MSESLCSAQVVVTFHQQFVAPSLRSLTPAVAGTTQTQTAGVQM